MTHEEVKALLNMNDIIFILGVASCVFMTIVQKVSTKYKPWTWLAEQFGKAANREMIQKLDVLEGKVNELEDKGEQLRKDADTIVAKAARRRILRFSDEIRKKDRHSEEFFNDVLADITSYKQYCAEHPEFQNEKAVLAIQLVETTYKKCMDDDDFL